MTQKNISIGVDIGGSHISCAAVDWVTGQMLEHTFTREEYNHADPAEQIFKHWAEALNRCMKLINLERLAGIGFAMPGPFEYRNGVSKMKHKFPSLYGKHIPTELNPLLVPEQGVTMRFLNDATAFAVGEAWQGKGQSYQKVMVITLGTGLGSAFLENGLPVVTGDTVPKEGCVWHLPYKNGILDDYFSTRWFVGEYERISGIRVSGVKDLVSRIDEDWNVQHLFDEFGAGLASNLSPWLKKFGAEILIVGGNIAHTLPLFQAAFLREAARQEVKITLIASKMMEKAALTGAARLLDDVYWEKIERELPNF